MCPNSCEATGQLTLYPTGGDNYGISDKQPRSGNDGDVGAQNLGAATASERGMAATPACPSCADSAPDWHRRIPACGVTGWSHWCQGCVVWRGSRRGTRVPCDWAVARQAGWMVERGCLLAICPRCDCRIARQTRYPGPPPLPPSPPPVRGDGAQRSQSCNPNRPRDFRPA